MWRIEIIVLADIFKRFMKEKRKRKPISTIEQFEEALLDADLMRIVGERPLIALNAVISLFSRGKYELVLQRIDSNHLYNVESPLILEEVSYELNSDLMVADSELFVNALKPHERLVFRPRQTG